MAVVPSQPCTVLEVERGPQPRSRDRTVVPSLRRGVFRVERARASIASKNSQQHPACRPGLPLPLEEFAGRVLVRSQGLGRAGRRRLPAAPASCWKGASARSHAQLGGATRISLEPCPPQPPVHPPAIPRAPPPSLRDGAALRSPRVSRGSQAGLGFLGRRAECYHRAKGKVFHRLLRTRSLGQAVWLAFPLGVSTCRAPGCPAPGALTLLAALSLSLWCPRPRQDLAVTADVSGVPPGLNSAPGSQDGC